MWLNAVLLFNLFAMPKFVAARFCEGGHICSLPRECCTQGCCPPYQSGPRQLPPPSEHVLNLFFISHWFFWCVVVAIILAILCAYSLWKKRRTLCGWGFPEHHTQSEGDSAGSCYAPPQYSRCNSFHHPPPPYTEVTSKPDLYPLVFTCNSDNVKNGSSYLMVQYFRNYIVRPAGSLSAASTVDSLSSSFICNANEANTLVPPPYSRAASPEIGFSSPFQQHYMLPRSASQLVCANGTQQEYSMPGQLGYTARNAHYTTVTITGVGGVGGVSGGTNAITNTAHNVPYSNTLRAIAAPQPSPNDISPESTRSVGSGASEHQSAMQRRAGGDQQRFMQSQSDQHFRYIGNSASSISDIFVNNSSVGAIANAQLPHTVLGAVHVNATTATIGTQAIHSEDNSLSSSLAAGLPTTTTTAATTHPQPGGTPVIFSNGCIKPNPLHRTNTNPTQFVDLHQRDRAVYNSCNSIGGISITVPVASGSVDGSTDTEYRDLHLLRRSLETCCHLLQQQQQQQQQQHMPTTNDSPLRLQELVKKYGEEGVRSYMTSGTVSGVSSLTNIGTPSSPPQATSPTGEVRDILDQIRQLQAGISQEELALSTAALTTTRPLLHHTMSSPTPTTPLHNSKRQSMDVNLVLQRYATMPEQAETVLLSTSTDSTAVSPTSSIVHTTSQTQTNANANNNNNKMHTNITTKRPATLQKKFYTPKPNKAMYIPMMATTTTTPANSGRSILKSPVGSVVSGNFFGTRNRVRKGWISRSAPTTPGTALPPNRLGDDSPLLNEHDEDAEAEQNSEFD